MRIVNQHFNQLKIEQASNKTFVGKISRGGGYSRHIAFHLVGQLKLYKMAPGNFVNFSVTILMINT
jgi:hypothetical protein